MGESKESRKERSIRRRKEKRHKFEITANVLEELGLTVAEVKKPFRVIEKMAEWKRKAENIEKDWITRSADLEACRKKLAVTSALEKEIKNRIVGLKEEEASKNKQCLEIKGTLTGLVETKKQKEKEFREKIGKEELDVAKRLKGLKEKELEKQKEIIQQKETLKKGLLSLQKEMKTIKQTSDDLSSDLQKHKRMVANAKKKMDKELQIKLDICTEKEKELKSIQKQLIALKEVQLFQDMFWQGGKIFNINFMVYGGRGSGKTLLYRVLSNNFDPRKELPVKLEATPSGKCRLRNCVHIEYLQQTEGDVLDLEPVLYNFNYADFSGEAIKDTERIIEGEVLKGKLHAVILLVDLCKDIKSEQSIFEAEGNESEMNIIRQKMQKSIDWHHGFYEMRFLPDFDELFSKGKIHDKLVVAMVINKSDLWMHYFESAEDVLAQFDEIGEKIEGRHWVSDFSLKWGSASENKNIGDIFLRVRERIIENGLVDAIELKLPEEKMEHKE